MWYQDTPFTWQHQWIVLLDDIGDQARLERGWDYAEEGAVQSVTVSPGKISAEVRGSRKRRYSVYIYCDVPDQKEWTPVLQELGFEGLGILLGSTVDDEVLEFLVQGDPSLIPLVDDLTFECSCPDWGYPCKHVAAVWYHLADRWTETPRHFFEWRGLDHGFIVKTLTHTIQQVATKPHRQRIDTADDTQDADDDAGSPPGIEVDLESFWHFDAWSLPDTFAVEQLPDGPPSWVLRPPAPCEVAFPYVQIMSRAYERIRREAGNTGEKRSHRQTPLSRDQGE